VRKPDAGRAAIDEARPRSGWIFWRLFSPGAKAATRGETEFIDSDSGSDVCNYSSLFLVNVATTRAGINMDAVRQIGRVIKEAPSVRALRAALPVRSLFALPTRPKNNPFMAGAFHGLGEAEAVINVGVSGPGVVNHAVGMRRPKPAAA